MSNNTKEPPKVQPEAFSASIPAAGGGPDPGGPGDGVRETGEAPGESPRQAGVLIDKFLA